MTEKEFWNIIDRSAHNEWKKLKKSLVQKLEVLGKESLLQYSEYFQSHYFELYRSDLFDLVSEKMILNEDAFNVLRKWIIYQGSDIYNLAISSQEAFVVYLIENIKEKYYFVDNPDFNVPQRSIFYKKFNEDVYTKLKSHPEKMK